MKFVCDNCGTQYLISDDKIGPKGAKVRCKRCGNIVVVRPAGDRRQDAAERNLEETSRDGIPLRDKEPEGDRDELGEAFDQLLRGGSPTAEHGEDDEDDEDDDPATEIFSADDLERLRDQKDERDKIDEVFSRAEGTDVSIPRSPAKEKDDLEEWYVAIRDEQVGPMSLQEVEGRWEAGEIDPGTLAWHPGMGDWTAVKDVPKLRYLLGSMEKSEPVPESVGGLAEPSPKEEQWAPAGGSSLASLVESEIEAVKESIPPPSESQPEPVEDGEVLDPWEKEEVVSGEVARPKESFFDSTLDQPVTDSSQGAVRPGRGLIRPAYLSEGSKGGLKKKVMVVGAASLVVLALAGVGLFKIFGASPEMETDRPGVVEAPAGQQQEEIATGGGPAKAAEKDRPEPKEGKKDIASKESEAGVAGAEDKSEADDKKDVMVVKKTRPVEPSLPPSKGKKSVAVAPKEKKKTQDTGDTGKSAARSKPKKQDAPQSPASGDLPQTLSKEEIASTMKKYLGAMKGCVQQQQQRDPSVTGTMLVSFVIKGTGKVSTVEIISEEHKGTYVAGCITYIIKSMKFSRFSGDPVNVPRLPLRLGG